MPWDIWLIFLVLAVVVPWRGRIRLKQLLAKPRVESRERVSLYLSTILFQWVAGGISGGGGGGCMDTRGQNWGLVLVLTCFVRLSQASSERSFSRRFTG